MSVAVAVVSWNTRAALGRCLDALAPEVQAGRAAVWVVDNGSRDGSPALVRDAYAWATLVERPDNPGFGAAVNLVASLAPPETRWIAPANADTALEPGALDALLAAGERDPTAGILAPRLVAPDGTTQHSVGPFPTLGFTLRFNLGLGRRVGRGWAARHGLEGRWDVEREGRVPWAVGAFLLIRREAWDAVGGFDPAQWLYAEDLDLGWRLAQAGWGTRYVPGARVRHEHEAATRQAFGDARAERWTAATYAWMERRWGVPRTRAIALVNVVGALARRALRITPVGVHSGWARRHAVGLRRPRG